MARTLSSLSVVASLLGVAGLALILGGCGSAYDPITDSFEPAQAPILGVCGSTYDSLGNANQVGAVGCQPMVDLAASSNPGPGAYQVALAGVPGFGDQPPSD